jgi:hypothetical protein
MCFAVYLIFFLEDPSATHKLLRCLSAADDALWFSGG